MKQAKSVPTPTLQPIPATGIPIPQVRENVEHPAIVAIGCSAGGLEAVAAILRELSDSTGMSFLVMQHLGAEQEQQLASILVRKTSMHVVEPKAGTPIEPNTVYVLSSHRTVSVFKRRIVYEDSDTRAAIRMPIDALFTTLADDVETAAIGVILSGNGSDGSRGIARIKAVGGITIAQDRSAKYVGMPQAAISTGQVDYVLDPSGIASELQRIAGNPYVRHVSDSPHSDLFTDPDDLNRIFLLIRSATGVDFSTYKENTIKRRIYRRMVLSKIENLSDYIRYLTNTPSEVQILHEDFLINVTSFFRDPETFDALKEKVFPEIVRNPSVSSPDIEFPIRIWVPGCSTGEEAYSIAIALLEYLGGVVAPGGVQIFATDLSETAINTARKGFYLENIAQEVSPDRLRKFFKKVEGGYQIAKNIRDLCVFAKQNMTKDPPFSRINLISCRNVLIYLNSNQQKLLIRTFHHALQPNGFLMLGTSETIGPSAELFHLLDKKNKIYTKKSAFGRSLLHLPATYTKVETGSIARAQHQAVELRTTVDLQKEADRIVLSRHTPPGVIVDDDFEIVQFRGQTSPFLEPAPGVASLNALRMVREGLKLELRSAITRSKKNNVSVRTKRLRITIDGKVRDVIIEAIPIKSANPKQHFTLALFEEQKFAPDESEPKGKKLTESARAVKDRKTVTELERQLRAMHQELSDTKEYLQRNIEDQDAYTEELKSANEEIQSSNEELQSTNEELETAKEELQSINEELTTLNDELHIRNAELSQANNDLQNLLANVNFSVVMVGVDHQIRRFNPMAERILNLIQTDIGRPIGDIKPTIELDDLDEVLADVIDSLRVVEREVVDRNGHWYALSIRPYKTAENKIEGAVIVLIDIDAIKSSLELIVEGRDVINLLKDRVELPIALCTTAGVIEFSNKKFYDAFGPRSDGKRIAEIVDGLNSLSFDGLVQSALKEGTATISVPAGSAEGSSRGPYPAFTLVAERISESSSQLLLTIKR